MAIEAPTDQGSGVTKATRLPCFDGLRAVAALSVVAVHTSFVSGYTTRHRVLGAYTARLEIGVAVFFVISGFLLYRPFARAHLGTGATPRPLAFWTRRLARIVPAYWLAFVVITYLLHADTVVPGWRSALIYFGFAQIYFPNHILTGVTQAWSLCTEMSFYLVLPGLAWALASRRRSPGRQLRAELWGIGALVAISLAFRIAVLSANTPMARTMTNWLPAYVDLFAFGMFLAVLSAWWERSGATPAWADARWLPLASWVAAALCFVAVSNLSLNRLPIYQPTLVSSLARQTLYGLFAVLLVLPAVVGPQDRGLIRWLLRCRPVAALGAVSYGVYLWHESWIMMFLRWTGDRLFSFPWWELAAPVVVLAVVSATLSYVLFERPAQGLARRVPFGRSRPLPPVPVTLPPLGTVEP